jgi:sugar (pentulose or hexulose) kinase
MEGRRAAEVAARQSFGKLVAWLTARCGDVAAAEDALGDAFLAAVAVGKAMREEIVEWNPVARTIRPEVVEAYARQYPLFKRLYDQTKDIAHALGAG